MRNCSCNRSDASAEAEALPAMFNALLEKAAAVVVTVGALPKGGRVLALSNWAKDSKATALAQEIARATGRPFSISTPTEFPWASQRSAIVVAPLAFVEVTGLARLLRSIETMGAVAVLV